MATLTTGTSAAAWRPDIHTFAPKDVLPTALILQATTVAGAIEGDEPSVRVAFVNDDAADFYAEAETIDESDPTLSEALVFTAKAAQLVRLSREQYYMAGTAEQLAASVSRALIKRADQAFLSQPVPTPPANAPSTGVLNVPGIVAGDTVTGDLDALVDLHAQLQANGATPNLIITDPLGWAQVRKLRTADGSNQSLIGAGTTDATPMLLSLPVLVHPHAPAYSGAIIDRSAIVSAVGQVRIATSEHAAFTSDSVLLRATWRIGHTVVRPDRVGTFTINEPGT